MELEQMSSLRHLNIDIHAGYRYSKRRWESSVVSDDPEERFDLLQLPNLETLRIPLRLFMRSDGESMRKSRRVLPATLKTLVLFVDLQPNTAEPLYNEETEWTEDEGCGHSIWYPRACAQSIRLTLDFLEDIFSCAHRKFPSLGQLVLECDIDDGFGVRVRSFRDTAMEEFGRRLQIFEELFPEHGIHFSSTKF